MLGRGGCRASTLLSMTPNKTTEIGTEEEEEGRGRREAGDGREDGEERQVDECVSEEACMSG